MAATVDSSPPPLGLYVGEPPTYGPVTDASKIAAFRDQLVNPSGVKEPAVLAIDLEGRYLIAEALLELVPLARAVRAGSLGPLLLVFCTPSAKLRDMFEALAERHQLALFIAPSVDRVSEAEAVGDLTATERQTLATVRELGGRVNVTTFAAAAGLSAPAATNRLVGLSQKGFMLRTDRPRAEGAVFMDPHAVRANALPVRLPPAVERELEIFAAVRGRSRDELLADAWGEWQEHADVDRTGPRLAQAWVAYRQRHSGELSEGLRWAQALLDDPDRAGIEMSGMSDDELREIRDAFQ